MDKHGKRKNYQIKLHIDEEVPPVAQSHRRVPFHVRKQLEEQLRRDEELGVIERIEGPTPWVSPIVKSDNGPPFNSKEFTAFADDLGFKHRKVTPKWARANGELGRFVRTVKKVIKTATLEHRTTTKR